MRRLFHEAQREPPGTRPAGALERPLIHPRPEAVRRAPEARLRPRRSALAVPEEPLGSGVLPVDRAGERPEEQRSAGSQSIRAE